MRLTPFKTFSDPLYGSIELTRVEVEIVNTQAFQRLRRVGQLGLMDRVFPSADYSRFAHSIGACHLLGLMLDQLAGGIAELEIKRDYQKFRLAMLLHDIGHYPMSHATEKAIKDYFKQANPKRILEGLDTYEYLNHEEFGREILLLDAELGDILRNSEFHFEPQELADIVKRDVPTPLKNLVSSELDADRMDYLMRSSQATGLPYGNFDREYLIKNLTVGTDGQVCLNTKALRAADHFLISRSFDYLQTVFHKVVVGMEQMLQECVRALINADPSKYEANAMREAITNGAFLGWDDSFLLNRLRELSKQKSREGTMAARIVRRKPPTLIYSFESSAATDATPLATHREFFDSLRNSEPELCEELLFWEKEFGFMDVSPSRTIAKKENQVPEEEEDKLIRIRTGNGASEPLYRNQLSLMKVLGDQRYSFARCYFVGELDSLSRVNEKFARLANMAGRSDSLRR